MQTDVGEKRSLEAEAFRAVEGILPRNSSSFISLRSISFFCPLLACNCIGVNPFSLHLVSCLASCME